MLMDMLEGVPSGQREWPNLVAKGYKQYAYIANNIKEKKETHKHGVIYRAHAEIHQGYVLLA